MKKVIYNLALFSLLTLFACISCNKTRSNETPNNITYDTLSIVDIYHLDNDSTKPSCSLQVSFVAPVKYVDEEVLAQVQHELNFAVFESDNYVKLSPQEALEAYKKAYVENYKQDVVKRFPDWKESGESMDYFSYYKKITTETVLDKGGILSYLIVFRDYKGGANSSTYYQNLVFDLKTGKRLTEEDIFLPDYRDLLTKIFVDEILKQNKVSNIQELMEDLGFFGIEDIPFNNNFAVTEKGIRYVFNEGEISPRSVGTIVIDLPYDMIVSILKPESPIAHFFYS